MKFYGISSLTSNDQKKSSNFTLPTKTSLPPPSKANFFFIFMHLTTSIKQHDALQVKNLQHSAHSWLDETRDCTVVEEKKKWKLSNCQYFFRYHNNIEQTRHSASIHKECNQQANPTIDQSRVITILLWAWFCNMQEKGAVLFFFFRWHNLCAP